MDPKTYEGAKAFGMHARVLSGKPAITPSAHPTLCLDLLLKFSDSRSCPCRARSIDSLVITCLTKFRALFLTSMAYPTVKPTQRGHTCMSRLPARTLHSPIVPCISSLNLHSRPEARSSLRQLQQESKHILTLSRAPWRWAEAFATCIAMRAVGRDADLE